MTENASGSMAPASARTSLESSPGVNANNPGCTQEESSQQSAEETSVNKQKNPVEAMKTELLKIRDVVVKNRKALIGLTDLYSSPILRRFEENLEELNKHVGTMCKLLVQHFPPMQSEVPATYASALKKQTRAVKQIKQSIRQEHASSVFETDKKEAQCSLFIPALSDLLSNLEKDLTYSSQGKAAKPTAEVVKYDLHWWALAKAAALPDTSLLKRIPGSHDLFIKKVILRRVEGRPTCATVECSTRDMKNLLQKLIRSKLPEEQAQSRTTRAKSSPSGSLPPPGPTTSLQDARKSTRVSDARLRFRHGYLKLNSSTSLVSHLANLVKTKTGMKSYDIQPVWVAGRAMHGISLKQEAGPLGPRVNLDPDKLVSIDNESVFSYVTQQLARSYPNVNANARSWLELKKELMPTVTAAHDHCLAQQKKFLDKKAAAKSKQAASSSQ